MAETGNCPNIHCPFSIEMEISDGLKTTFPSILCSELWPLHYSEWPYRKRKPELREPNSFQMGTKPIGCLIWRKIYLLRLLATQPPCETCRA